MAVSGFMFLMSALAFVALIGPAILAIAAPLFFGWRLLPFSLWAIVALIVAAFHTVRTIELINAPELKGLGWLGLRSFAIAATCPILWVSGPWVFHD